jgi:hypothetical protein
LSPKADVNVVKDSEKVLLGTKGQSVRLGGC